jgi:hypothetical protein
MLLLYRINVYFCIADKKQANFYQRNELTSKQLQLMKKTVLFIFVLLMGVISACSDSEKQTEPTIVVDDSATDIAIPAGKNNPVSFSFYSSENWTAVSLSSWLSISPKSGSAGNCTLSVTATEANPNAEERVGYISITAGSSKMQKVITITQESADQVIPAQSRYQVPAEGTDSLGIIFTTNMDIHYLAGALPKSATWIHFGTAQNPSGTRSTGEMAKYCMNIYVDANPNNTPRSSSFYFLQVDDDDNQTILTAVEISQAGQGASTSTDFSTDKQVRTIQTHTAGRGVPIVLTGDGFLDTDVASGWFDQVMDVAAENLFTEEPYTSLRPYFDVYAVTAVSKNNIFGSGYTTTFSCELEGGTSTGIDGDHEQVANYVNQVGGLDLNGTLAVVILNTNQYAGTTYWGLSESAYNFAIAYCPIVTDINNERFRQVLLHEAMGHGFAKLADEYFYDEQGTIPTDEVKDLKQVQTQYGWFLNVDTESDPAAVRWATMLTDSRFSDQDLGVYEGGYTYIKGVYRPTPDSMMRQNQDGFNAPSRQAIYNCVMKLALGTTPTYEEFAEYDVAHPYRSQSSQTKAVRSQDEIFYSRPLHAPVVGVMRNK